MRSVYFFAVFLCVIGFGPLTFGAEPSAALSEANALYDAGNCKKALDDFNRAQAQPGLSDEDSLQIQFRSSYCHLNLGDNDKAVSGFTTYLKKDPTNDEARLRLIESEFNLSRFSDVRARAEKVKDPNFRAEAMLYAARASVEMGDSAGALKALDSVKNPGELKAAYTYWRGVATYNSDDSGKALSEFKLAMNQASEGSWVKSDGQGWISRIEKESQWLHGSLSVGYISDSNVAQSASGNLTGAGPEGGTGPGGGSGGGGVGPGGGPGGGGPGGNQQGGPPLLGATNSIQDTGKWLSSNLTLSPYTRANRNVNASLNFSSPYYSDANRSYNYMTYGGDVSANMRASKTDWWGGKVQLTYAFYDKVSTQNYLILDPYYSMGVTKDLYLRFGLTDTNYLKNSGTYTLSPAVSGNYSVLNWLSLKTGVSYTLGAGAQATYTPNNPPSLLSGSAFSNYNTYGGFVGFWTQPVGALEFSGQYGYYKTAYKHESAPTSPGAPAPSDRADTLSQIGLELFYPVIRNLWSFDLSATFSNNKSDGFQGIPNGSSLTTYTYDRAYYLLSTTVSF